MKNGYTREDALDALHSLDMGCDRDTWHTIGRAAIAAGLTVDDINEASKDAHNYVSDKDVQSAFRDIKPEGGTGAGTLFFLAKNAGWSKGNIVADKPVQATKTPTNPRKPRPGMSASEIWARCIPVPLTHDYAVKKQLSDKVLSQLRVVPSDDSLSIACTPCAGYMAVPAYTNDGTLQSIQFVPASSGKKLNLPCANIKGATFTVGKSTDKTVFVESMATADSIWQATGYESVCCFGSGNIKTVIAEYRSREPDKQLVICPDKGKEEEAVAIASEYRCSVILLPESETDNFDFNDLFCRDGSDVLQALFDKVVEPKNPDYPVNLVFADELPTKYEPPDELIEGLITAGAASVLYGDSNSGKTFVAIDMACSVARGVDWQGRKVEQGAVVYIAAESPGSVQGRLQEYQKYHNCTVPNFAIVKSSINLFVDDDKYEWHN